MAGVNQSQQLFIQAMMTQGALLEADVKQLYHSVLSGYGIESSDEKSFDSFLTSLNHHLKLLDMQIVHSLMEDSYERWYGLVNRSADPGAKIATRYTLAELEFFNKVMETLATENGMASSTVLINMTQGLERKMTGSGAQSFLTSLIKSKWLREISTGKFGAGPRFVLELRPFLSDIFKEDVVICQLCREAVVRGDICGSEGCNIKLHLLCIARFAQGREKESSSTPCTRAPEQRRNASVKRVSIKCPGCHGDWTSDLPQIDFPGKKTDHPGITLSDQ
ncbi:non-structural maintenance of chromosomes element 1 homolog isoform X2 [Halichondria panicea]|uniref:non-structural maintenance of chromosomes element 1 homolog isoform X2 n=1 Tax=Halichondria panicea TaxID=6063 RepID=UPI00312BC25C